MEICRIRLLVAMGERVQDDRVLEAAELVDFHRQPSCGARFLENSELIIRFSREHLDAKEKV